jgi:hypothetical protein
VGVWKDTNLSSAFKLWEWEVRIQANWNISETSVIKLSRMVPPISIKALFHLGGRNHKALRQFYGSRESESERERGYV